MVSSNITMYHVILMCHRYDKHREAILRGGELVYLVRSIQVITL